MVLPLVLALTAVGDISVPPTLFHHEKSCVERAGPAPLTTPAWKIIEYDDFENEDAIIALQGTFSGLGSSIEIVRVVGAADRLVVYANEGIRNQGEKVALGRSISCHIVKCRKAYSRPIPPLLKPAETAL